MGLMHVFFLHHRCERIGWSSEVAEHSSRLSGRRSRRGAAAPRGEGAVELRLERARTSGGRASSPGGAPSRVPGDRSATSPSGEVAKAFHVPVRRCAVGGELRLVTRRRWKVPGSKLSFAGGGEPGPTRTMSRWPNLEDRAAVTRVPRRSCNGGGRSRPPRERGLDRSNVSVFGSAPRPLDEGRIPRGWVRGEDRRHVDRAPRVG